MPPPEPINPKRAEWLAKQAAKQAELSSKFREAYVAHKDAKRALRQAEGTLNRTEQDAMRLGHALASMLGAGCYYMDGEVRIGKIIDSEWRELVL